MSRPGLVRRQQVVGELQAPLATVAEQLNPAPSPNETVPVGVPAPGDSAVTVKLTASGWPVVAGSGKSDVIVVIVSRLALEPLTAAFTSFLLCCLIFGLVE